MDDVADILLDIVLVGIAVLPTFGPFGEFAVGDMIVVSRVCVVGTLDPFSSLLSLKKDKGVVHFHSNPDSPIRAGTYYR